MIKLKYNRNGFGTIEGILILVIIAMIVGVGLYVYKALKNINNAYSSAIQSSQSTAQFAKTKASSTNSTAITTNPYAGWKSYTLTDEKLSFQYPPTWQIKDYTNTGYGNQDYQADWVTFTSADGFEFDINDGLLGGGDGIPLISNDPVSVTYSGQSAYMVFSYSGNLGAPGSVVNKNQVAGFMLLTNPNNQSSFPSNKYVTADMAMAGSSSSSSAPGEMHITGYYSNTKYFSSVELAMQDKEYQNAKLVIESMHY